MASGPLANLHQPVSTLSAMNICDLLTVNSYRFRGCEFQCTKDVHLHTLTHLLGTLVRTILKPEHALCPPTDIISNILLLVLLAHC